MITIIPSHPDHIIIDNIYVHACWNICLQSNGNTITINKIQKALQLTQYHYRKFSIASESIVYHSNTLLVTTWSSIHFGDAIIIYGMDQVPENQSHNILSIIQQLSSLKDF